MMSTRPDTAEYWHIVDGSGMQGWRTDGGHDYRDYSGGGEEEALGHENEVRFSWKQESY